MAGRGRARRQPVSPLPPAPRSPRRSGASVFFAGLSPPPLNAPHLRRPGSAARAKALSRSRSSSAGCPRLPAPLPAAPQSARAGAPGWAGPARETPAQTAAFRRGASGTAAPREVRVGSRCSLPAWPHPPPSGALRALRSSARPRSSPRQS